MDPLSICASAVALIGASKSVTKALYSFTQYATHAEAHVALLCSEMTTLAKYLSSISKTLKSCRRNKRALALVDAELWRQSDLALQDCEATLNELSTFVAKLTTSNKTPFWRARVAFDMSIYARKLNEFRVRLKRSNCALQTVLQTITVSLSVQNNASQDLILYELNELKQCIEDAVWIAKRSPVSPQSSLTALSESMATKNLHSLVKAAENFHSSATSTVGSSIGGSIAGWPTPAIETGSIAGLTPYKTERVHEYIQNISQESNPFAATMTEVRSFEATDFPEYTIADGSAELPKNLFTPIKSALDADFELCLHEVLEDFAIEKMKLRDFENAAAYLKKALSGKMGPVAETKDRVRLQIRLGICYVLQRKIPEAWIVISKLERNDGLENIEVLHLMHALAMVHFAMSEFAEAKNLCERILKAKMKFFGKSHPETLISLGFSRYLYDQLDQPIEMEATRRLMPHDYVYKHPESEFDFLAQHAVFMPVIALEPQPGPVELPCTYVAENSQDAQTAQTQYVPNHHLKRALTRYETQQSNTMKVFLSATVTHPDEEEFCPGPGISASRNGRSRMISRSMTTMRRHLSTWRSSKLATVREGQASTENPSIQRCGTVLHKAPSGSQMESARSTGLIRAKRLLSILKKERPIVTAPTEETFQVFELDATCVPRKHIVEGLEDTGEAQNSFADQGVQASLSDVLPSEPLRVSVPPLDMSLVTIPELPELDSGYGYDLENPPMIVIEDSSNSSDGSISRGSSNRSTVSGSSYSTNTTVSEASPASPVDCGGIDNFSIIS
ncbi:uncharacterized protein BBA_03633 [Beauveria bassiana ARSEF 2860]|uniref:Fungal N-terminal domain-containing protein n=1 Tax=Beauveria bassiana (strain ARSEF 2860) TaxID=655819 RepID=J4KP94_BEAB2|nr:uncharacterized protein BBA_03633 [Beauveria bassiana ARSEF 2860]EJP67059.1 hypothetical protein BBA_03633 [Beauveria bassiana ARSEF 2860]